MQKLCDIWGRQKTQEFMARVKRDNKEDTEGESWITGDCNVRYFKWLQACSQYNFYRYATVTLQLCQQSFWIASVAN